MTKRWIFQNKATRTSSPVVSFPRKATLKEESATGQATSLSWENDLMMNTFKKVDVMMLTCWLFSSAFSRNLKIIRKLDLESQLKARVWKPSHLNADFPVFHRFTAFCSFKRIETKKLSKFCALWRNTQIMDKTWPKSKKNKESWNSVLETFRIGRTGRFLCLVWNCSYAECKSGP